MCGARCWGGSSSINAMAHLRGHRSAIDAWEAAGVRQSAADAYLRPFLDRPNLTVLTDAMARKLVHSGSRCTGVEYTVGGELRTAEAGEVVVCAGVIGSPHLLLLSGIGPLTDERNVGGILAGLQLAREIGGAQAMAEWRQKEVLPGPAVTTNDRQRDFLRHSVGTYWHPSAPAG
jgi:choline dehydrogenase-like flavoprotein